MRSYWINTLDAIWQSTVIFFMAYFAYIKDANIDALGFGFSIAFSMLTTSMIHVLLQTTRIDMALLGAILLSFLTFLGFSLVFDATCVVCLSGQSSYHVSYMVFRQGLFWLTNLLTVILAMLPRFLIKVLYNSTVNPLKQDERRSSISSSTQDTRL